jgi:hypothetical protein
VKLSIETGRRERERREKGEGGRNLDFNAILIPL